MVDLLRERGGAYIKVFGEGDSIIVPREIAKLQAYGVARIYSPEDDQRMGLVDMIGDGCTIYQGGRERGCGRYGAEVFSL
jgi:isobutyryl-CoA mutase